VFARFVAGRDRTLQTMAETRAFLDANAAAWPDNHVVGKAAYEQMLRDEQLLPFDSADIERMARDELAHGWAEEAWLRSLSAHRKLPFGAASGGGMAPSGPALVGYYRDRIAELQAFVREHDVVTVPAWLGAMEDRRDAGVPATGLAGRVDEPAAPVLAVDDGLLLHHAADVARRSCRAARHERGLRP
jgi:hypothetical protein